MDNWQEHFHNISDEKVVQQLRSKTLTAEDNHWSIWKKTVIEKFMETTMMMKMLLLWEDWSRSWDTGTATVNWWEFLSYLTNLVFIIIIIIINMPPYNRNYDDDVDVDDDDDGEDNDDVWSALHKPTTATTMERLEASH